MWLDISSRFVYCTFFQLPYNFINPTLERIEMRRSPLRTQINEQRMPDETEFYWFRVCAHSVVALNRCKRFAAYTSLDHKHTQAHMIFCTIIQIMAYCLFFFRQWPSFYIFSVKFCGSPSRVLRNVMYARWNSSKFRSTWVERRSLQHRGRKLWCVCMEEWNRSHNYWEWWSSRNCVRWVSFLCSKGHTYSTSYECSKTFWLVSI